MADSPSSSADVVVVGGGVMGAATAWQLAGRGADVVVVEQFEAGHRRGSSHGGSRIFRFAYADPWFVRLAQRAEQLWGEASAEAGEPLLEVTGGVDFGDPDGLRLITDAFDACAVAYERLSAAAARERWPGFAFDGEVVHSPGAGRVRADAAVAAFARVAAEHGADVRHSTTVEGIDVHGGAVTVRLAGGAEIRCRVVVIAAGAWVGGLASGLAPLPPLKITQEQVFHFTPRDPGGEWPSFIHHQSPYIYGLTTPGEGVKVAEHHTGRVVDPDARDFTVDPEARARVVAHVERWMPGLDPVPHHEVTCLYTTTPDESFVLERHGPVVIGSACSGHGFKFAPAIGERLAALAMEWGR